MRFCNACWMDAARTWWLAAVLCGNNGEACWAKYGSYPLHKNYCHEMALRILLACLTTHAARHKRVVVPVSPFLREAVRSRQQ